MMQYPLLAEAISLIQTLYKIVMFFFHICFQNVPEEVDSYQDYRVVLFEKKLYVHLDILLKFLMRGM